MADIYAGLAILTALAATAFAGGLALRRRASARVANAAAVGAVVLTVLHLLALHDGVLLLRLLPFSNAIVLSVFTPIGGGFLAGLAAASGPAAGGAPPTRSRARRVLLVVPLVAVAFYPAIRPLTGRLEVGPPDRWRDGVCVQTRRQTCGAAAAATLLAAHGIETTGQEMVRLCLTTGRGTLTHGMYRALAHKTAGTRWRVEPLSGDIEALRAAAPALLIVELRDAEGVDPRYVEEWSWQVGVAHAVVLFGFTDDGLVEIGDPSVGRERWRVEDLSVLWHGEALRLALQ